jgi:hypothetical protein
LLAVPATDAGTFNGSPLSHVQKLLTQVMSESRVRALKRMLASLPLDDERATAAFNVDIFSSQFLHLPDNAHLGLGNADFYEAFRTYLGLESLRLQANPNLSLPNGTKVDPWGNNMLSAIMKGDTTRTKHDGILHQICVETSRAFKTAQEPSDVIRHVNGGGQGMRPDMLTIHNTTSTIYDLKTLSPCKTHYNQATLSLCRTKPCSAVEKRQDQVHKEYVNKAKAIDRKNGAPEPGPALAHLESFGKVQGLVIGPRGEASSNLHALVERVCKVRAEKLVQESSYTLQEAKAVVKRGVCRRLGATFVKHNMICMRQRISILSGGSRSARSRHRLQARTRSLNDEYYLLFGFGSRPFRGLRV